LPHDAYASLRIPNFRWFIVSVWTLTIATQIQTLVVQWQIYAETHDPLSLGLVGLAEAVPFILVALYAGHVADRQARRAVVFFAMVALLGCGALLYVFTRTPGFIEHGRVWPVYLVVFLSGIARSFARPASSALGAEIVPRDVYQNAIAWRTSTWQFAAVVGPAAGGFLYALAGPAFSYLVVVGLMVVAVGALMFIEHAPAKRDLVDAEPIGESLRLGVRFVLGQPVILGAMTLDLFSVLFGGATALLPIFAAMMHVGPQGLGALRAAPALGSVATGILIAYRPPMRHAGRALFLSVGMFGICMILFAISRNFFLSFALLTASGAFDNVSVVIRSTLLQTMTPTNLLGRVSAVNQIFIGSSNEIGAFESGVAARLLGTVPSVLFGGVMTIIVVLLTAWQAPQLRKLREIRGYEE
jgi:MFS family permease